MLEHLQPGSREVLDVGVGGCPCMTLTLAQAGYRVVALDRSMAAIAEARLQVERERLLDRVTFLRRDAAATGLPDGAFENVTAFDALGHMRALRTVIREIARVTTRRGRVVIGELTAKGRLVTGHPADGRLLPRLHALLKAHFARVDRIDGAFTSLFVCSGRSSSNRRVRNGTSR